MIGLLRGWLGWALGAVAAGVAVVAAVVTTGDFPRSDPEVPEAPAEVAALPEAAEETAGDETDEAAGDEPAAPAGETPAPAEAAEADEADGPESAPETESASEPDASEGEVAALPDAVSEPEPETDETAETAPEAGSDEATDTDTPAMAPPEFDVVRVDPNGSALIAGHAAPGSDVTVMVEGEKMMTVTADAGGNFVAMFDLPLSDTPRIMQLMAALGGEDMMSDKSVIVEPRDLPVQVAEADTGTPTSEAPPETTEVAPDEATTTPDAPTETAEADAEVAQAAEDTAPVEMADAAQAMDEAPETAPEPVETPTAVAQAPEVSGPDAPEAGEGADMAEADAAPEAPEVTAEAEAPRVLLADRDGITVLQDGAAHDLSLDAIAYDDAGEVTISGRGQPGGTVRLYLDNGLVGDVPVGPAGQWRMTLPESVEAGIYTLRVDEVAEDGTVMARVESPFKREDREMLAAALGRASEAREGEAAAQDEVEMAEADMADPAPTATTEDMAAGDETAAAPEPTPMPAETAEAVTGTAGEDEAPAMPAEPADTAQAGEDPAVPDTPAAEGAVESGAAPPANAGDAPEAAEAPMEAAPDAPEAGDTVTAAMDSDAPDTASAPDMPPADSDPKAPAAEPMISAITVQPGSTLWAISRERYGDGLLYVQVFEANRDKIRDPDLIYPGQVFELPADVSGN